jgi:hypothetical protein
LPQRSGGGKDRLGDAVAVRQLVDRQTPLPAALAASTATHYGNAL